MQSLWTEELTHNIPNMQETIQATRSAHDKLQY
jgi:hypothetical protein